MPGARRRPGHPTIALVLGPMCSGQALRRRSARPSWSGAAEAGRDGPRRRRLVLAGEFVVADVARALWFDVAGAALVSAAYPSLQAARLGIMPARLWGRAESVRTLGRSLTEAVAPLAFGGSAAWSPESCPGRLRSARNLDTCPRTRRPGSRSAS